MTVLEIIRRSSEFLERKGVDSARLQTELLLAHVLGVPRLKLYLDFERTLTNSQLDTLRDLVKRRGDREPLQYILGTTSFCGLELSVNPAVLIPRPETEALAESAWTFARTRDPQPLILDYGTGSGCLAIALAVNCANALVHAVDVSAPALKVARDNAARHKVAIEFHRAARLTEVAAPDRFDLIVSNPPYIPLEEIRSLQPEVRDHEPRIALDGGADGLVFHRMLAGEARHRLLPGGRLMLEVADGQADAVSDVLSVAGWRVQPPLADLSGRPRIIIAEPL